MLNLELAVELMLTPLAHLATDLFPALSIAGK